ncbi:MAG TPA: hypothetical protein EYM84_10685 [Flavobacteriales bacterium]|nr:hypothetical protein [Flavobacteriales bacterium]
MKHITRQQPGQIARANRISSNNTVTKYNNVLEEATTRTYCHLPDNLFDTDGSYNDMWLLKKASLNERTSGFTELAIKLIYDDIYNTFELDTQTRFIYSTFKNNLLWYADCSVGILSQWRFGSFTPYVAYQYAGEPESDYDRQLDTPYIGYTQVSPEDIVYSITNFIGYLDKYNKKRSTRNYFNHDNTDIETPEWLTDYLDDKGIVINNLDTEIYNELVNAAKEEDVHPKDMYTILIAANGGKSIVDWYNKGNLPGESKMTWRQLIRNDWKQLTRTDAAFKKGATGVKGWRPFKAFTPSMLATGPTPLFRKLVRIIASPVLIGLETLLFSKPLNEAENFDFKWANWTYDQHVALMLIEHYSRSTASGLLVDKGDWTQFGAGDNYLYMLERTAKLIFDRAKVNGITEEAKDKFFYCYQP